MVSSALTAASASFAQVEPVGTAPVAPAPTVPPSAPEATAAGNQSVADGALSGMEETRKVYEHARKLLGGEHVSLTAMAYVSRACDNGERFYLDEACSVGAALGAVAGVVSVPLWGAGGGHGSDWFPVLHTEEETDAFGKFESYVDDYLSAVRAVTTSDGSGVLRLPEATRQRLRLELLRTVDSLTRRADEDDASYFDVARTVRACVESWLDKQEPEADEQKDLTAEAAARYPWLAPCLEARADLTREGKMAPERLGKALEIVKEYVRFVTAKPPLTRHNILIGPALGFPITKDPTQTLLWGAAAEVGWRDSLRLGLGTGFVLAYDAPIAPMSGFYVGLSLSGALGDELVHFLGRAAD